FTHLPIAPAPATAVTFITSAAGGGVWLGYDRWLHRWDGRTATPLQIAPGHHVRAITQAFTDSSNRVWIAFDNGRIGVVDAAGAFRVVDDREGLANGTQPFVEDDTSALWAAGSRGISLITDRG